MFANNSLLCRFMLRRDRIRTIIWFVCILGLVVGFTGVVPNMYSSEADIQIMSETLKSPAMIAMMGPAYYEDGYTVGALYSNMMLLWSVLFVAIMNIFLVVRHTRQDEEQGRIEVVRSLPVGRMSNLSAVLTASVILNTALALLTGLGLGALGIESMDFGASMLFGAALGVTGLCFAGITAGFCQLCASPQTAQALSFAFLGVAFLARAAGDMQSETLALISPLGLILRAKVYTVNQWWPVLVMLLEAVLFSGFALRLCGIRDMGAGLIPPRPGRRDAARGLSSAEGLARRLLRTPFIIWALVVFALGASYGSIMGDIESFISTNEVFKMIVPDGSPASFISYIMLVMSIMITIPVLQFILKAGSQEKGGFAEGILSRAVSRNSQLLGYFVIAFAASIVMPFMMALGFYAGSFPVMDNPIPLSTFMQAAMAYTPALWIMLGISMLLTAYLPRLTVIAWAYLGYTFFAIYIGTLMGLPDWLQKLSPYGYVPKIPAETFDATGSIVMALLTVAMALLSFMGYRKRDMKFS